MIIHQAHEPTLLALPLNSTRKSNISSLPRFNDEHKTCRRIFIPNSFLGQKKTPTQIQFADEKNTFNLDMPPHFIFSQQIEFKMKVFRFSRIPKKKLKINFPYRTWTKLSETTGKTSKELPCNMIAQLKCCKVETFLFFSPLQIICRFLWRKKSFAKFFISFVKLNSNCGKMLSGEGMKTCFWGIKLVNRG